MAGTAEQAKGRAKEAVGGLTGDEDLVSEGRADRHAGEAKEKVGQAKDKIEDVLEAAEKKAEEAVDTVKDALHRK